LKNKIKNTHIRLFTFLNLLLVWSSQTLSVEIFGGNLRFGFLLLVLCAPLIIRKISREIVSVLLLILILGVVSGFSFISLRPIIYVFLLIGNTIIFLSIIEFFKNERLRDLDVAIYYHLIMIIIFLVIENIFFTGRAHLFFKEPSYLGIYLSCFIFYGVVRNNNFVIVFGLTIALLSISMFSIFVVIMGILLQVWQNFSLRKILLPRNIIGIVAAIPLSYVLGSYLAENRYTKDFFRFLDNISLDALLNFLIYRGGSRVDRMLSAWHYFINHTSYFVGVGPGNFVLVNNPEQNSGYIQINEQQNGFSGPAINVFVEFLVEFGLLSTLCVLLFLITRGYRIRFPLFLFSPVLFCMFFESSYLRPAFWIAVAFGVILSKATDYSDDGRRSYRRKMQENSLNKSSQEVTF
jgi:hypothetical protein